MEKENWIETILKSTNGITSVEPSDDLLAKIKKRINRENTVSSKTVWLVAASITVLAMLNFSVLLSKTKEKTSSTAVYLETTVNQSNQLYK